MKLGKILLGENKRKYVHDLSHDVNSTFGFGNVQPSMCQYMSIGDSLNLNAKQLVRLAPLPVPTFGRMSVVNRAVFVPCRDVFPYFDAMLSNQTVTTNDDTFIPKQVPVVSSLQLCTMLMRKGLGKIGIWRRDTTDKEAGHMIKDDDAEDYTVFYERLSNFGHQLLIPNTIDSHKIELSSREDSISSCDYLLPIESKLNGESSLVLGVRLTAKGRRVHSILRSLGYSMTFTDTDYVSALPILAYYKAWFDCYHPKLDINWHDTDCWLAIMVSRDYDLSLSEYRDQFIKNLFSVVVDLSECFYTSELDYVSAHKAKLFYDENEGVDYINSDNARTDVSRSNDNKLPYLFDGHLSRLSYDALTKLTRYATKDTLIGSKIYDWIRVHYGQSKADALFNESTNLGSWIVNADISDVISSAETYNSDNGNGDFLGSYAGRGIGFNNGKISYKANDFGYFIILTCVVPKSGYSQGTDPSLYGTDTWTLPNPDFDAVGYEATPVHAIYDDSGISFLDETFDSDVLGKGFGFIPRYSGYKIAKNVISGDFSRRSTRDGLDPYHLDRIISTSYTEIGKDTFIAFPNRPPYASTAWRYPTKYEWLGNFNRVFYNNGKFLDSTGVHFGNPDSPLGPLVITGFRETNEPIDDNFIVQTVFDVKYTSLLKPIRESYDVFDNHKRDGESTTSVSAE